MQGEVAHTDLSLSVLRGFFFASHLCKRTDSYRRFWVHAFLVMRHIFSFGTCGGSFMRFTGRHTVNSVDGRH